MVAPILPHFTKSQRTIILSFIDAFIAYLHEHNPKVVDRHPGTTAWMQNTASEIMKRDEFNAEKLGGRRPADVQKEICTYYRNFKNNNYKKKLTATTHSHPSESSPPSKLAITALKDTIRGLVVLESDLSARDIFFREADSDYRKVYKQVKSELPPETPAVVITQKAPKRAWNEADQELWETRKAQLELDCKTNQQSWPKFYRAALQQNLDRGIVGNAVIGVMYAFRDELDGLQHGILYAGYDAAKKDELRHQPQSHSDILKLWVAHADVTLPYSSAPPVCLFDCDDDGFPILPNIDIHEVVLRQVAELLRNYLSALWEHTYPPNTAFPTIPWAEIAKAPVDFIDTTLHNLPTALGCPVPCNPVHTLSLYDYLSKQQELGDPFRFRTKSDIDERRRIQAKEAVMELLKDDENLDIAQSDVDEQSKPVTAIQSPSIPLPTNIGLSSHSLIPPNSPTISPQSPSPDAEPPLVDEPIQQGSPPETPPTKVPPSDPPTLPPKQPTPPPSSPTVPPKQPTPPPSSPTVPPKQPTPPPNPPTPPAKHPKAKSARRARNGGLADLANARRSNRDRKQAVMDPRLVAGGQKSPKGRRHGWSFSANTENVAPASKRPRLQ